MYGRIFYMSFKKKPGTPHPFVWHLVSTIYGEVDDVQPHAKRMCLFSMLNRILTALLP